MATKKITTTQFAEAEEDQDEVVQDTEGIVVNDDLVSARVKGTWTMYWGRDIFAFEDGKRYRLPRDLFNYLKTHGNIYDTMA